MSYVCNGVVEFHANEDTKEEFLKVFNSGADFALYGSWVDSTCYLYRSRQGLGGWYLKHANAKTVEQIIDVMFTQTKGDKS